MGIWTLLRDHNEILLLSALITAVSLGLVLQMRYRKQKKKLTMARRHVEMGLRFYDEDDRFLSIKDKDRRYYLINTAHVSALQKTKEDFIGRRDEDVFEKELAEKLREADEKVLETGERIRQEITWQGRIYRMHKFPLTLPHGEKGVGARAEDITDAVKRREERERVIRRNEILLDVSAKDFRSTHEQLDYVLKQALVMTESSYGYIYLYDALERTFMLENFAQKGIVTTGRKEKKQIYRLERMGLWSESVKTGKPMIHNRASDLASEKLLTSTSAFNMMTVPVIMEEKIVAVIGVANTPEGYSTMDAEELSLLMTGVWNAKERRESTVELKKANLDLAENKDKLALILNSSAEGIYGMDVEGNFTFINKSALKLLGYEDAQELIGKNCHELIHHSTEEGLPVSRERCRIYDAIDHGDTMTDEGDVFHRKDGSFFPVRYSTHPQVLEGEIIGSVVTFSDITDRKKQEEEVLYLSYHDALTGLYNRTYLEKIRTDLTSEKNMPLCVVVGDVNGLKLSNDIFGHKKGDEFLRRIAEIIESSTREEDLLFRVGGDEFYLFLKNTQEETAQRIMERITRSISEEDFHGIRGGIALGLSVMKTEEASLEHVMNDAEQKMYREKTLKKNKESIRQLQNVIEIIMKKEEERIHAENTMKIAEAMGASMGMTEEELTKLKDAAYVHDIGKITKIMSSSDENPLTVSRKDHAVIGYRILNSFEQTMDLARIVLSHHEKWDGSGYPKGLKGEEIPLLSRIITVAERYDRLTSDFGRNPLKREEALEIMKSESGRILDGTLVDVLARLEENPENKTGSGGQ